MKGGYANDLLDLIESLQYIVKGCNGRRRFQTGVVQNDRVASFRCTRSKRCRTNVTVKEFDIRMMCSSPDSKNVRQAGLYVLSHLVSYI